MDDFYRILSEATNAATCAQNDFLNTHGDRFPCGFGWVTVRPANCKFVNWCKKQIKLAGGDQVAGVRRQYGHKSYEGGWTFWSPGSYNGQSVDVKEVGARAFAEVLRKYGIDASVDSRLD